MPRICRLLVFCQCCQKLRNNITSFCELNFYNPLCIFWPFLELQQWPLCPVYNKMIAKWVVQTLKFIELSHFKHFSKSVKNVCIFRHTGAKLFMVLLLYVLCEEEKNESNYCQLFKQTSFRTLLMFSRVLGYCRCFVVRSLITGSLYC